GGEQKEVSKILNSIRIDKILSSDGSGVNFIFLNTLIEVLISNLKMEFVCYYSLELGKISLCG
ncbi:MAG: hypothetical protein ACP5KI_03905, partial [Brevinematia bacterium]